MPDVPTLAIDQADPPAFPDVRFASAQLPAPLTSLVGRGVELREVTGMLDLPEVRLLTLTGPGGVGKTRLAIEAARRAGGDYADGVAYLSLASIRDPRHVLPAVARTLVSPTHAGGALLDLLADATRSRHVLLVLDNFEHLLAEPPLWLSELLGQCPRLKALVTSRAALQIGGEHRYEVPPLPVRDAGGVDEDAVALFAQRAAAMRPGFVVDATNRETVVEICRRLDGLPLAVELAAARMSILTPPSILARLTDRFGLLASGQRDVPVRLRSLHDAIAWSHDLLDAGDQRLFRRLSVFVGGFSLEAAEAVCAADGLDVLTGLASLVDKSLLRAVPGSDGGAGFLMLETIREFAWARLVASDEVSTVRDRHAAWYRDLVCRDAEVFTPFTDDGDLGRLTDDYGNIRAALAWLDDSGRDADLTALANRLRWFWYINGHFAEGAGWYERLLQRPGDRDALERCDLLTGAAFLAHYQFNGAERVRACLEEAQAIARAAAEPHREADATFYLATMDEDAGRFADAAEGLRRADALYDAASDPWSRIGCDYHLGIVTYGLGRHAEARRMLEATAAEAERMGDRFTPSWCRDYLILLACDAGDAPRAVTLLARQRADILTHSSQRPEFQVALAAAIATVRQDDALAARLYGAHAALVRDVPLHCPERETIARYSARSRDRLGDDRFEAAWAEGRRLREQGVEAAIEAVLGPGSSGEADTGTGGGRVPELTERELEVLRLMADGITNREIADALFVTRRTVNTHIEHILAKLEVRSRTAAVAYAVRNGLA